MDSCVSCIVAEIDAPIGSWRQVKSNGGERGGKSEIARGQLTTNESWIAGAQKKKALGASRSWKRRLTSPGFSQKKKALGTQRRSTTIAWSVDASMRCTSSDC
jgi:hypothetical protein